MDPSQKSVNSLVFLSLFPWHFGCQEINRSPQKAGYFPSPQTTVIWAHSSRFCCGGQEKDAQSGSLLRRPDLLFGQRILSGNATLSGGIRLHFYQPDLAVFLLYKSSKSLVGSPSISVLGKVSYKYQLQLCKVDLNMQCTCIFGTPHLCCTVISIMLSDGRNELRLGS